MKNYNRETKIELAKQIILQKLIKGEEFDVNQIYDEVFNEKNVFEQIVEKIKVKRAVSK